MWKRTITVFMACATVFGTQAFAENRNLITIYVSSSGNDFNDGMARQQSFADIGPVKTPARASEIVRKLRLQNQTRSAGIEVVFEPGVYQLSAPWTMDANHSGDPVSPVIYRAELPGSVVITGGVEISGWSKDAKFGMSASYDATMFSGGCPTQLFINGKRKERPRLPTTGTYTIRTVSTTNTGDGTNAKYSIGVPSEFPSNFQLVPGTEIVILDAWTVSRMRASKYDPQSRTIDLDGQFAGHGNVRHMRTGLPFYIENPYVETLEAENWFCDKNAKKIFYQPSKIDVSPSIEAIASRIETLLQLNGADEAKLHDVIFQGLSFRNSAWALPKNGWAAMQAEVDLSAAIELRNCSSISFKKIEVTQTGSSGIAVRKNCSSVEVRESRLTDLGGGGIVVGSSQRYPKKGSDWPEANVSKNSTHHVMLTDNVISSLGRVQHGATGIWVGQANNVSIVRNIISDLFYSGISIGWSWNSKDSLSYNNFVDSNIIYDFGKGFLSDFGGIYTLGLQNKTVISNNIIMNGIARNYGGFGIYADEGSSGIEFTGNTIRNTSDSSIFVHLSQDLLFQRNVGLNFGNSYIACSQPTGDKPISFIDNVGVGTAVSAKNALCDNPHYIFQGLRMLD